MPCFVLWPYLIGAVCAQARARQLASAREHANAGALRRLLEAGMSAPRAAKALKLSADTSGAFSDFRARELAAVLWCVQTQAPPPCMRSHTREPHPRAPWSGGCDRWEILSISRRTVRGCVSDWVSDFTLRPDRGGLRRAERPASLRDTAAGRREWPEPDAIEAWRVAFYADSALQALELASSSDPGMVSVTEAAKAVVQRKDEAAHLAWIAEMTARRGATPPNKGVV